MDPADYYNNPQEQERVKELLSLVPSAPSCLLDVGARTGYISRQLARRGHEVTALDLDVPAVSEPGVNCVAGDVTALHMPDGSFDLVLCAEVLEHIPPALLAKACSELLRVSRRHVLIGVPFQQDLRLWQTTCPHCGKTTPPWAHVNRFDEARLRHLFHGAQVERVGFVGQAEAGTNAVSAWLMSQAGNPYGTYVQDEPCLHCNRLLAAPPPPRTTQRALAKAALALRRATNAFKSPHPNWIHVLFSKTGATPVFSAQ